MAKRNPQQEQADQREARKKIIERALQRHAEYHSRQEHESLQAQAKMTAMPIHHEHAAASTSATRATGLRQLVEWLKLCEITTVAMEATGVHAHVLFHQTERL